jgi:2-oxoglutarate dehydrogenase E2 component (dihydrolipoamide succinyltransferase)
VKLPKLGDTADAVVVLQWVVDVGDRVGEGEALLQVETDKIETEVPAPVGGTLVERLVDEGDDVAVGTAIAVIEG